MQTLAVDSRKKNEIIDITKIVGEAVGKLDVDEGLCTVYVPHATAALIINEYEPNLENDFLAFFERLAPQNEDWMHNNIDNNAAAHLKSALFSPSAVIPVKNGSLVLGAWQRILFCEFDGPRQRKVIINVIGND